MKKVTMGSFLVRTLLLMVFIIGSAQISFAQKNKGKTQELPAWIRMMDEPGVNYCQAVAEFEKFWEGRVTPIEENELFETGGEEERERELRERKQKRLRKNDPAILYAFEYKRFKHWQDETAALVKPDGAVMTMDERVDEWKKEKELRKTHQFKPREKEKGKDSPLDPQKKEKEEGKDYPFDPQKKEKEVRKDHQSDPHKPANGNKE